MIAPVAVDVLGFFNAELARRELFGATHDIPALNLPGVIEARDARDAVAELIEASKAFAIAEATLRPSSKGYYDARERFLAALARVGGAQ